MNETNQPTTTDVDNYFTKNYSKLYDYSQKIISKYSRKYDAAEPITEAYINCINCINNGKITQLNHIEQFTKSTIFFKISQWNSSLNKPTKTKISIDDDTIDERYIDGCVGINHYNIEESVDDLMFKFKQTLRTYDLRMFEIVFEKNIDTAQELAKHLDISISQAYGSLKDIKTQLRLYIKTTIKTTIKHNE